MSKKIERVSEDYLWRAATSPAVMAIRSRAWQLLGLLPGARVLDIGCGPGTATLGLAARVGMFGAVVGIDSDPEMVKHADATARAAGIAGWTRHQEGNATALAFPPASFDACYCERVLQHLTPDQGAQAVAEAARVTRPGGTICFVDSDWASFSVEAGEDKLERKLHGLHLERFRNPYAGRTLGHLLRAQGLGFVVSEPVAVALTAAGALELLSRTAQKAREAKQLSEGELSRWRAAAAVRLAERDHAGHLTMVIAVGRRL
jgi:ubiquinone/menaquinone biosynthesis C-methylase UbiE